MTAQFVHLHTHSQYSLLESSLSIADMTRKAASLNMRAAALTDAGNLYGAVDFYKSCKEAKVKPIIGCEFYLAPVSRHEKKKQSNKFTPHQLTLLAKNLTGYHNLCELSSRGFLEGFYYYPRIDFELLSKHAEGLICLSGNVESQFAHTILTGGNVAELIQQYRSIFGSNFYFELQRHTMTPEDIQLDGLMDESWRYMQYQDHIAKQDKINKRFCELGKEHNIPVVATNNCHYLEREDYKAHEILINIQSGEPCEIWQEDSKGTKQFRIPNPKRSTFPSHELYFKTPQEMHELFADIPEALHNSLAIAEQCDLKFDFNSKHYPVYTPPTLPPTYTEEMRKQAVQEYLYKICKDALPSRYTPEKLAKLSEKYPGQNPLDVVQKRLDFEMQIISSKDMCDYLLIVWDFIYWAKKQGIPMGPGRGSGAGSIICYLSGITDIEPLRFGLLFERFINPERISYPDIDVDICMSRRGEVINYTMQKYGKSNVAQIITFGAMKAKMVIRDVGRTLSIPLSKVNAIIKLVPEDLNITIDKALEKDAELNTLYMNDQDARKILDIGKKLEGCLRSTGLHAAGLIVSGKPLIEHIPICNAKDSDMFATQYSMKPVEMMGMLKIDFLGLKTLTCIQICQDAVHRTGKALDWTNLPLDDAKTFTLLNQGKTAGIFQIETGGMQELAKNLHLDKFEEIIAVLSLYRPGPMDMIPSYIARKHKREPIEYDHPWMVDILSETYGIMVYQEQVMQIASKLANYSLGEGDVLRRAMGKKDTKEMAKQREKFITGAAKNNIHADVAGRIFDKMEKFAEYGFNKSHAAAYGYLTYVTAYLKAHFPAQWLAALMTCDQDDVTKLARFTIEGRQMQLQILPPDINESELHFAAITNGIRFSMNGIKGVGSAVVEAICKERKNRGPFTSLYDFIKRLDLKCIGKKAIELLINAGCFDFTNWHRDALIASIDQMYDKALKNQKESASGILNLFQKLDEKDATLFKTPPKLAKLSSKEELLVREKALLGFFLSGHPLDSYKDKMKHMGCLSLAHFDSLPVGTVVRTAFLVDTVTLRISSRSQKKFAIITISDGSEVSLEMPIWPELYEEIQHLLIENQLFVAVLVKEKKNEEVNISCKWVSSLKEATDSTMKACDTAFDKAKLQQMRPQYTSKPKAPKQAKENSLPEKEKPCLIKIDLEKLVASHILKLQNALDAKPGDMLVQIQFVIAEQEIATLHLDSAKTICFDEELQTILTSIDSVKI